MVPINQASSTHETQQELQLWLIDQLTILGVAMGEAGDKITKQRLQVYAKALVGIGRTGLEIALHRAMHELTFFPKIAELEKLAVNDGRPGVEEAWAMCPKTEDVSAVWTAEIADAFGACRLVLADGDAIAARMIFKERYSQLLNTARANHAPVRWTVSLGWEPNDRVRALSEAVQHNRIPARHAMELLGAEQQDELLAALPVPQRKQLTGDVKPNPSGLSGLQSCLVAMRQSTQLPSEVTSEPRRRHFEMSDEERGEHAKRVREQAERLKKERTLVVLSSPTPIAKKRKAAKK